MSQVQHSSCGKPVFKPSAGLSRQCYARATLRAVLLADTLPLELWQQVLQHLVHEEPGPGTDEGLLYSEHLASLIQVCM